MTLGQEQELHRGTLFRAKELEAGWQRKDRPTSASDSTISCGSSEVWAECWAARHSLDLEDMVRSLEE